MTTSLTIVRRIKARPEIVFDAMTRPEELRHWFGPDAGPVLIAETDPRVGGKFRIRFRTLDDLEHEATGQYLELKKPERMVMSWRWTGGVEDPGESRIIAMLRPIAEGTELTFTHELLANEETRTSHHEGWTGSFDKLEKYFADGRHA